MTTVVEILNRAARMCSVSPPSSWVSATDATSMELKDFLDETREDIATRCDWIGPIGKVQVITGTGDEDYALPTDFLRLQRDDYAVYERERTRRPCNAVTRDGEWEYLDELGVAGAFRYYRIQGYDENFTIGFKEPLETDLTVVVSYVSKVWTVNGSTEKTVFTAEDDICLLPRRLVEAGIVYRFRRRKALAYQDVLAEYEILMARGSADTRGRRKIMFGGQVRRLSPWDIPVPDFIPPS